MFTLRLAWRYAFSKSNRHRHATMVILSGIAVGMMALVIMLSLMNSLQSELLEQVRSIESFHVQVSFPANNDDIHAIDDVTARLNSVGSVTHVFPYINTQVLVQHANSGRSATARLRIIDSSIWVGDNPFATRAGLMSGSLPGPKEIAVGTSLATKLGARNADSLSITLLVAGRAVVLAPATFEAKVSGLFRSGLPEFDASTIITDVDPLMQQVGPKRIVYGLYLKPDAVNRPFTVQKEIEKLFPGAIVRSWQEVNSAFYSALLLEKLLMYVFLLFMFIILGVNMKNASSRLLHAKMRELAILRAIGSARRLASRVFLGQAAIITVLGELAGIFAALFLGNNIERVFSFLNHVQYVFTGRNNMLLAYPFVTQVRPIEVLSIALIVLLLSLAFTYIGCRRMLGKEPMEILYHD